MKKWFAAIPIVYIVMAILIPFLFQINVNKFKGPGLIPINPMLSSAPNIVLIVVDTLRADHLSTYWYHRQTSPRISDIAEEGVIFENAYANSNWTPPSVTTLLTSLYESQHMVSQVLDMVPASFFIEDSTSGTFPAFPATLSHFGYNTALFSANPVVNKDTGYSVGFDYVHQLWEDFWRPGWVRNPIFYPYLFTEYLLDRESYNPNNPDEIATKFGFKAIRKFAGEHRASGADRMYMEVTRYLDYMTGLPGYSKKDNRFFLYAHFMDPHSPYRAPMYVRCSFGPCDDPIEGPPHKGDPQHLNPSQHNNLVDRYDEEVSFVDFWIWKLVDYLKKKGLFENTLLIITADHGEAFYEHGHYGHGVSVYDEEVHIPLIVTWPDRLKGGLVIKEPVSLIDIAPTIFEAVSKVYLPDGSEKNQIDPTGMSGKSFWKLLLGQHEDREVFGETQEQDTGEWMRFVVKNGGKYIQRIGDKNDNR